MRECQITHVTTALRSRSVVAYRLPSPVRPCAETGYSRGRWISFRVCRRPVQSKPAMRRNWRYTGATYRPFSVPVPVAADRPMRHAFPLFLLRSACTNKVSLNTREASDVTYPHSDHESCPFAATEGNVSSRRPGMLDMLGRAKWCVALRSPARSGFTFTRFFLTLDPSAGTPGQLERVSVAWMLSSFTWRACCE